MKNFSLKQKYCKNVGFTIEICEIKRRNLSLVFNIFLKNIKGIKKKKEKNIGILFHDNIFDIEQDLDKMHPILPKINNRKAINIQTIQIILE